MLESFINPVNLFGKKTTTELFRCKFCEIFKTPLL